MQETCPICQTEASTGQASCAVCGFHFANNTLSFSPVDIGGASVSQQPNSAQSHQGQEQAAGQAAPVQANTPVLRMVRGNQLGTEYKLNPDKTSIGRNPQCDIFLNDMTVSRTHASIVETNGAYIISDEQSFNGVWVNNRSINNKTLEPGDFIQIGRFGFLFDSGE